MAERHLIFALVLSLCLLAATEPASAMNTPVAAANYLRLLDYIQEEDLSDPLMVFGGIEEDFDRRLNQENLTFINTNSDLLQKIQAHLRGEHLRWQLNTSFKQLWVVPEPRDEYARLFERYCKEAVHFLLERINQPNPYRSIATLKGPLPDPDQAGREGITAYLVHNVADEYIEEYLFFDQDNEETQIRIKLSNREFDGKIGSYTSKLKIGAENRFEFVRENYTLWQNSAQNPYNVLIVPIEETLHIILREATEQAMQDELTRLQPEKLKDVKSVIDHWMAIEEAVVGGLVWQIMPDLLNHLMQGGPHISLAQAMAERDAHEQYKFLNRGIDLVTQLGIDETIQLYQSSAKEFKIKLIQAPPQIVSLKMS